MGRGIDELFTQAQIIGQHSASLAGAKRTSEFRVTRDGALRVYQVFTAPITLTGAADSRGVMMTLRDVTELAQAIYLKTDFVANASHELRTPLSSIRAATETLADGAWEDAPMRERLTSVIAGNVQRLEEMVRDLLDLSRLDSPDAPVAREEVSLVELAEAMRETFTGVCAERKLTLETRLGAGLDVIVSDRKLLTTIVRNLIDNATKFAYEQTTVNVTIERAGSVVRISVSDQGVGIPLGHQQRIFERFYQVDPSRAGFAVRRGTGLGLAIVKHAVKALGGTIGVESVWKQGTTMTVEVPGGPDGG
jgi:signal transduction histidine kinase